MRMRRRRSFSRSRRSIRGRRTYSRRRGSAGRRRRSLKIGYRM